MTTSAGDYGLMSGFAARSIGPCGQEGFSLIELIICIVVMSIALTGIMSAITYANLYSGDPVIRQQAVTLAQAKMEEVLLRDFYDADDPGVSCPPNDGFLDNVCDYNGDVETPPAPLDHYTISVSVVDTDNLGTGANQILGSNNDVLRIDVTVTHDSGETVTLSAYRTSY
jgi:MSHA pilin protein MshD